MRYCPNCGKEINDDIKFCPSCGHKLEQDEVSSSTVDINKVKDSSEQTINLNQTSYNSTKNKYYSDEVKIAIKIFLVLSCVSVGWFLLPLIWILPLTITTWKKLDSDEEVSTAISIVTLLFCSLIAGILLLVGKKTN